MARIRWQPRQMPPTFLRYLRELAGYMGCPRQEICRPMAWHWWLQRSRTPWEAFCFLAGISDR